MGDYFWSLIVNKALRNGLLRSTGISGEKPNGDHSVGFKNMFYGEFAQEIPLTVTIQTLPDMQGAGAVRDLRGAAKFGLEGCGVSEDKDGLLRSISETGGIEPSPFDCFDCFDCANCFRLIDSQGLALC